MYRLRYRIKTCSPIVISAISGDMNMVTTEKYIPGTTVLGVMANRYIEQKKADTAHKSDTFYHWFLKGDIRFSNAYIVSYDEYGEHSYYPTPFSIEQEKYGTDVFDFILDDTNHNVATKYVGKFCRLEKDTAWIKSVETNINFHHARDEEKGSPKMIGDTGIIFNFESINRGQVFGGDIIGEDSDLRTLLQTCGNQWPAFVGRSRNAQYGSVDFSIIDEKPELLSNQIINRKNEKENLVEFVSMILQSNLILYNEFGYPTTDTKCLVDELKKILDEVVIEQAFVKKTEVENFVGIWQLKKPSETCFAAGSIFLLKINPGNHKQLTDIQIGERTHEGFGRCVFGFNTNPTLTLRDESEENISKPKQPIPTTAKDIIKAIIKDLIQERIELEAINKMNEFVRLPSTALIAKLGTIVKSSNKQSIIIEQKGKLRKIAADKLKRCVSRDCNLWEFLEKDPIDWDVFFRNPRNNQIRLLCKEIDINIEDDKQYTNDLSIRYYTTFFSMMRKRAIAESEAGENDQ